MQRVISRALIVSALASLLGLPSFQVNAQRTWDLPPGVKTMLVNNYEMAYIERGTGPVLVLVHGVMNDYRIWGGQIGPLGARFRVIAVSLRHYFPEKWNGNGDDLSVGQHASDMAAFIKGLNSGPVHLLGHSRGGAVAAEVAKTNPELLRSLVLADPALNDLIPQAESTVGVRATLRSRFEAGDMEGGLEAYTDAIGGEGSWKTSPEPFRRMLRDNAWTATESSSQPPFSCPAGPYMRCQHSF